MAQVQEVKREKVNLKYQRDKDKEIVRGIFRFYEVPGGSMSFVYKAYKGDEVARYDLVDGEVASIPLGVAKHLNNNMWYPVHSYTTDETGRASMRIGQKVHRCGFQSMEFIDDPDLNATPSIVTVEKV